MSSTRALSFALAAVIGLGLACQERLVGEDESEGRIWCSPLTQAFIVDDEGEVVVRVQDESGEMLFACRCLPDEEALSGEWDAQFNEDAYDLCLHHAERMGYPDAENHTCDESYEMNVWGENLTVLPWEREDVCVIGGETPSGCSVR